MLRLSNITLKAAPESAPRCTNTPGPSTYISLTSHRRSLPEYPNRRVSAKVYLFLQFSMQPGSINPSRSAQVNNSPAAGQDLGPACAFNMDMLRCIDVAFHSFSTLFQKHRAVAHDFLPFFEACVTPRIPPYCLGQRDSVLRS